MTERFYVRFACRGYTAAEWVAMSAPQNILLDREIGLETDTDKFKFGDGVTEWDALPYVGPAYAANVLAFLEDPTSAKLRAAITDETGTGKAVFADAATLGGQLTVKGTAASTATAFQTQDSSGNPGVTITDNGRMMGGTTAPTFPYYFVSSGSNTLVGERSSASTNLTASVVSGGAFRNPDTTNGNYSSLQFLGVTTTGAGITFAHIACVMTDHTNGSIDSDFAFVARNNNTFAEVMRVTGTGRLGIGTSAPEQAAHVVGAIKQNGYTVAGLAGLPTPTAGTRSFVTDSTVTLTAGIGAVVAGGGANFVPVHYDGANWRIG